MMHDMMGTGWLVMVLCAVLIAALIAFLVWAILRLARMR